MLTRIKGYVYERRQGLLKTATVVGGLYLTGQYALDRLAEMREQVLESRKDRDMCVHYIYLLKGLLY